MSVSKQDREKAQVRIALMQDLALELFTDPRISTKDLQHYAFTANVFGPSAAIERCLTDIDPKYTDLKREILIAFAYCALAELVA